MPILSFASTWKLMLSVFGLKLITFSCKHAGSPRLLCAVDELLQEYFTWLYFYSSSPLIHSFYQINRSVLFSRNNCLVVSVGWKHTRGFTQARHSTVNRRDAQNTSLHSATWGSTFAHTLGRSLSGVVILVIILCEFIKSFFLYNASRDCICV